MDAPSMQCLVRAEPLCYKQPCLEHEGIVFVINDAINPQTTLARCFFARTTMVRALGIHAGRCLVDVHQANMIRIYMARTLNQPQAYVLTGARGHRCLTAATLSPVGEGLVAHDNEEHDDFHEEE